MKSVATLSISAFSASETLDGSSDELTDPGGRVGVTGTEALGEGLALEVPLGEGLAVSKSEPNDSVATGDGCVPFSGSSGLHADRENIRLTVAAVVPSVSQRAGFLPRGIVDVFISVLLVIE
jgi:hypothetical protein